MNTTTTESNSAVNQLAITMDMLHAAAQRRVRRAMWSLAAAAVLVPAGLAGYLFVFAGSGLALTGFVVPAIVAYRVIAQCVANLSSARGSQLLNPSRG